MRSVSCGLDKLFYSFTFLASGSSADTAESSLSSLSYPPNAPKAGAAAGAERFLLVSDVAVAFGIVAVVAAVVRLAGAGGAGEEAISTGVVFKSREGDSETLTFVSFFFITPLSSDLTVFFGGSVEVLVCFAVEGCDDEVGARPGC